MVLNVSIIELESQSIYSIEKIILMAIRENLFFYNIGIYGENRVIILADFKMSQKETNLLTRLFFSEEGYNRIVDNNLVIGDYRYNFIDLLSEV
jgi:hypothetical protein